MIRLFAALSLPDDLRARLAALGGGIDGARWVGLENLHITLRYIGEVSEPVADEIVYALGAVRAEPFSVTLVGAGHFESRGRPRAVWVGVKESADLVALHDQINRALIRSGLPPEGRKYTPHITIGWLKDARHSRVPRWLETNGAFFAPAFEIFDFILYESRIGRKGSSYLPIVQYPLTNTP